MFLQHTTQMGRETTRQGIRDDTLSKIIALTRRVTYSILVSCTRLFSILQGDTKHSDAELKLLGWQGTCRTPWIWALPVRLWYFRRELCPPFGGTANDFDPGPGGSFRHPHGRTLDHDQLADFEHLVDP